MSHQPINNGFCINIKRCSGRCVSHSFIIPFLMCLLYEWGRKDKTRGEDQGHKTKKAITVHSSWSAGHICLKIKGTAWFNNVPTSPWTKAVTHRHAAVHLWKNFDLVRWVRGCLVSENPHRQEFLFYREFLQTFFTFCVVMYKAPWLQEPKDISRLCRLVCVWKMLQRTLMTALPNNISSLKGSNHLKGVR